VIGWLFNALDRSFDYFEGGSAVAQHRSVGERRKLKGASLAQKMIGRVNAVIVLFMLISSFTAAFAGNTDKAITSLIVGVFLLAIGFAAYGLATFWTAQTGTQLPEPTPPESGTTDYYAVAGQEILTDHVDPALWARALIEGDGNEHLAKAKYVAARVAQLQERGTI